MSSHKKRRIEDGLEVDCKKGLSSYERLKIKFAVQKDEMKGLNLVVEQLRRDLKDALKSNEELQVVVRDVMSVSKEKLTAEMEENLAAVIATSSYQARKTKQTKLESNNSFLKSVLVTERHELQELKKANEQLKAGSVACRIVMQELRDHITNLSNANDAQTSKLQLFEKAQHEIQVTRESERRNDMNMKRLVLKAFGWEQVTADPTLIRAAIGFWKGTAECTDCDDSRTSLKRRMDIWINLTNHGFNGRVHDVIEKSLWLRTSST